MTEGVPHFPLFLLFSHVFIQFINFTTVKCCFCPPFSFTFLLLVVPANGHVDLKSNLTPPLITHTAATPMPVPKLPVGGESNPGYETRRGSSSSVDPACYDKSPVCVFI